jgi:hypothetical protein
MVGDKRKPGQRLKRREVKGGIISYALDQGGQFEETTLKNAVEEKFNVSRDDIKKHLKDFERTGIFKNVRWDSWQLKENVEVIAQIYNDYPQLLQHLQQSDLVLNCVAKKHSSLYEDNAAFEEFKTMLRLSPKLFELSLKINDLGERFSMVHSSFSYFGFSDFIAQKEMSSDRKRYIRWELYRSCLKTDTGFLEKEDFTFSAKLIEMVQTENRKRKKAEEDYIEKLLNQGEIRHY